MNEQNADDAKRTALIRLAGFVALFGNLLLAATKLVLAKVSNSIAVAGDGIDSLSDVAVAAMTLVVAHIIAQPSDKEHPWGHGRAETMATMILAFIIFFAGAELALSSARQLIERSYTSEMSLWALVAALISICGKSLLAASQFALGKKSNSEMIKANAQNMRGDIIMSTGVLAGIVAARVFKCPALDPITALLVSAWVIKNAVSIFLDMNAELMDGNTDEKIYRRMFEAVKSVKGVSNPHRARIRKMASHWDIDLDIEVDGNLTVSEAHEIANKVEQAVRNVIPDVYDIMVHIEPEGYDAAHKGKEQYGLSERDLE